MDNIQVQFFKCTPNTEFGIHYLYDDYTDYIYELATLSGGDYTELIDIDNFRFTANYIDVNLDMADMSKYNYLVIKYTNDTNEYYEFYYVTEKQPISGFVRLSIQKDLWACGIKYCAINNCFVKRCNRDFNFGSVTNCGLYENIEEVQSVGLYAKEIEYLGHKEHLTDQIVANDLVLIANVTIEKSSGFIFNDVKKVENALFVFEFSEPNILTMSNKLSKLKTAVYTNDPSTSMTIEISKVYVVPKNYVRYYTGADAIKLRCYFEIGATFYIDAFPLLYTEKTITHNVEIDPNYKYYLGTKYTNIEISRNITTNVMIHIITTPTNLKIIVEQGNKELDVTEDFEVPFISITQESLNFGSIVNAVLDIAKIIPNLNQSGAPANAIDVSNGNINISNYTETLFPSNVPHRITKGNAYESYLVTSTNEIPLYELYNMPIVLIKYKSVRNEIAHVSNFGVLYNDYKELSSIFEYPFITEDSAFTYVQAIVNVESTSEVERNYITNEFAKGIKLVEL